MAALQNGTDRSDEGYKLTEEEGKILYDVFISQEWPEAVSVLPVEEGHSLFKALAKTCFQFAVSKLRHPFSSFRNSLVPPSTLISLIGSRLPWQLAITSDGNLLAVLREDLLEIRSIEDDFEIVSATCAVEKDPHPQWRKLVWSEDGSFVAMGTSYGSVCVFTHDGRSVCSLPGRTTPAISDADTAPLVHAVVGLTFVPVLSRGRQDGMPLLAVLHYGGSLDTYQLRAQASPLHLHSFSLLDYYPHGVASMAFHHRLNILIVGSCPADGDSLASVSGWRLLDGAPYWAPLPGQSLAKKPKTLFGSLKPFKRSTAHPNKELVFAMSISPGGSMLATIEVSGRLSLWDVPSFRLRRAWNCEEQPTSNVPLSLPPFGSTTPKKKGPPLLLDVSWWSDEALILVNSAGEVTVPSIISLCNLLGESPEPGSCVTPAHDGQFFIVECESRRSAMGRYRLPSLSEDEEGEGEQEEEEDEEFSLTRASTNFLKQMLYFITDSERFRPAQKKPKVVLRKYRLACLRSMPPEECYERKMQQEEYGEALLLARQYGLDCDLVYQRQWQNNPVSTATIQDYLSKISKHQWVLQECLGRVPKDYDAARELLQYGLTRTAFKELKETMLDDGEAPTIDETASFDGPQQSKAQLSAKQIEEEISKWEKLTPEQMSLCQYRHMLLTYLDRLSTYEVILGGPSAADEHFDATFFLQFRSSNLVTVAISFARESDWRALDALFTYHGNVLLPHRLAILSNIPETTPPQNYKFLLPALNSVGELETWETDQHRELDWIETQTVRRLCVLPSETKSNAGEFLYEENPEWRQYESPISADVLTTWYTERATEIEKYSGQIDNALGLLKLGIERGVKGLSVLHHQLQTLHTLVYQCNVDSRLSLTRLQNMSALETLQIMMKESCGPEFIHNFCAHAVPFLVRINQLQLGDRKALVEQLLTSIAKDDLAPCLAVFQQCKGKGPASAHEPVISDTGELMKLALRCVYACKRSDQLEVADKIVECLPLSTADSSKELAELHCQVDKLEDHLSASDILKTYGVHKPVNYIRDTQENTEEAQALMVKLTRIASRQQPPLSELGWRSLLQHLLSLRTRVFNCLDQATCYKVFSESLLCSGSLLNINLASQLLSLSPTHLSSTDTDASTQVNPPAKGFTYRLPTETSLHLVLSAAREYFNSASSLMDKDMNLARACLDLFPAPPPLAVQSELNLIASLSLLDDFSVGLLPVQVRLCENKLDMIRRVLDATPTSYKKYDKVLQLAHLLGLDEVDFEESKASGWGQKMSDGRGHTLILVTLVATERGDFKLASQLCSKLMKAHFPPAWEVCRQLGCQGKYKDLDSKVVLLDFALTHCPPEEIQQILKERNLVEVQALSLRCQGLLLPSSAAPKSAAVQQLMGRGVQIVSKGAGAVQHLMGQRFVGTTEQAVSTEKSPSKVLDDCLSWLQEATSNFDERQNLPISPAYYPFYAQFSKVESKITDSSQISYSALKPVSIHLHLALNQALLRAINVANTFSCGEQIQDCTQVLLDLAEGCSQADTQLMLGYLLSLSQPSQADKFFSRMAPSKFSLQLAVFYMCLQLCSTSTASEAIQLHPYLHPSLDLVEQTASHVMSSNISDWTDKKQSLGELLKQYQELLADHTQAEVLQSLGLGIDVQQFTQDPEYKRNTILSLARAGDTAVMTTALSLAQRHNISEWELYMAMLDWLLTESGLSPQELQKKIKEVECTKVLFQNPQQTADALQNSTYPKLPGTKYGILLLYYSLLQQCRERGAQVEDIVDSDTHIKLIKKLRSSVPGLDYKAMMSGEAPLLVLRPVLFTTNVHVVAKLANKIPSKEHGILTPGMVFQTFAEKLFWEGDEKHQRPQSTADWVHRYEACHEYLGRLSAKEFSNFVHNIALSPQALTIGLETRTELVKRAAKTARQRVKPGEEVMVTPASQEISFEVVALSFQQSLKHLQNLSSPELKVPIGVSEELWDHFMREFDLTLSQQQKVHILLISMIEKGLSMSTTGTILFLVERVHTHSLTVTGLVKEVLQKNLDMLSETPASLATIERVLSAVSQYEKEVGTLISSGDVLSVLRPYCSEQNNPGSSRRALLQLMEKYLQLSQDNSDLLLLYHTQSLLAGHFNTVVSVDSISSPDAQQQLFTILLKEAKLVDQLKTLASLLETWPDSGFHIQCWLDLLHTLLCKPEGMTHVVTIRAGLPELPQEVDEELFSGLLANSTLDAMKFALITSRDQLIHQALKQLKLDNTDMFDADLLELVIVKEKLSVITMTPLYPVLCKYLQCPNITGNLNTELFARLLHCPISQIQETLALSTPAKRLQKVVKQLCNADFKIEAGSLFLSAQLFHPGLQTMNTALGFMDRL